jgi:hypothetical protein
MLRSLKQMSVNKFCAFNTVSRNHDHAACSGQSGFVASLPAFGVAMMLPNQSKSGENQLSVLPFFRAVFPQCKSHN